MSRVDDERDAARDAARRSEDRHQQRLKNERASKDKAAFAALVEDRKQTIDAATRRSALREAIARMMDVGGRKAATAQARVLAMQAGHAEAEGQAAADLKQAATEAGHAARTLEAGYGDARQSETAAVLAESMHDRQSAAGEQQQRFDEHAHANRRQARQAETLRDDGKAEDRRQSSGAAPRGGVDDGTVDRDGGGKSGGGGDQSSPQQGKNGQGTPGFRLNPALLPPPPVAVKKDMAGSERFRRLAAELAQKIVERARVGVNAAGLAEFQIDLRSNVLSGLQIRVSSRGGKISAIFQGRDPAVLRQLRDHAESLKEALKSRGLALEELKIEAID